MTTKPSYPFILENKAGDALSIAKVLDAFGLCVLPAFLSSPILEPLTEEVKKLQRQSPSHPYPFGSLNRLDFSQIRRDNFPYLEKCFHENHLHSIAKSFFDSQDFTFNQRLIISKEFQAQKTLNPFNLMHFDRLPSLQFMIYLTDVTKEDGAFCCIPKTHSVGTLLREKAWEESSCYDEVKNRIFVDYPEMGYDTEECVSVVGKRGTLVVFNSDTFHYGGVVQEGHERLVVCSSSELNDR